MEPFLSRGRLFSLAPSGTFNPEVDETWTILSTLESPVEGKGRYEVSVMPGIGSDKYFNLQYVEKGSSMQLLATVTAIENLFDLEDSDSVNVEGIATDVVVADLGSPDGPPDGFDDIALTIGGADSSVYIFINDGTGNVDTQITYSAGNGASSLDAGDLDGDGTMDLAITNANDDSFFVLLNDGGNAFSMTPLASVTTGDNPIDILIVNIDDDTDHDLIVSCHGEESLLPSGAVAGELRFYEATPSMRVGFTLVGTIAIEKPGKVNPGDVNNDKDLPVMTSLRESSKAAILRRVSGIGGFGLECCSRSVGWRVSV